MDNKFTEAKIYLIKCKNNENLVYVGSTTDTLYNRLRSHKSHAKKTPNRLIYKTINDEWDNWFISLYELYPCNNKVELCKREGEVIRLLGTLNVKIEGRSHLEWRTDNKDKISQYYYAKQEAILKQKKEYYLKNREKILKEKKEYYDNNKRFISLKNKERYINNKYIKPHQAQPQEQDAQQAQPV
jgi:hypothetical protein